MDKIKILVINPGSTSTKVAVFENENQIFVENIKHNVEELKEYKKITDQFEFRKKIIEQELKNKGIDINKIKIVMGRGGLLRPIESGVYEVNQNMITDLKNNLQGEHASNLGGILAYEIAKNIPGARAFIADPVVVDEMDDIARVAGHPKFTRKSIFHALNQKAVARSYAKQINEKYENLNLIVVHLGGGISVGAHNKGRVIDVNQALNGDGPFSPERSGTLPVNQLIDICFDNNYTKDEIKKMVTGKGGLVAYLGTNDAYEVEIRAQNGDEKAKFYFEAMAYQVAKEIGALSTVLKGDVDAIILTGGIAKSQIFVEWIKERVAHIAKVVVFPGEDEMRALALNGLAVFRGELQPKVY